MERIFHMGAVVFALFAAYFFWPNNTDWAFASGVLAAASFFLSIRFQMKARNDAREAARKAERETRSTE